MGAYATLPFVSDCICATLVLTHCATWMKILIGHSTLDTHCTPSCLPWPHAATANILLIDSERTVPSFVAFHDERTVSGTIVHTAHLTHQITMAHNANVSTFIVLLTNVTKANSLSFVELLANGTWRRVALHIAPSLTCLHPIVGRNLLFVLESKVCK